jgi:outer membrane lipoprotein-sorting protein
MDDIYRATATRLDVPRIIRIALFALAASAALAGANDKSDPEEWLRKAEATYAKVAGYTAIFHRQQRIGGKLQPEETIFLKFRKPFSVYMKWIKAPYKGSELLYMTGWNENRIKVHRGGILRFITRDLEPNDPTVMKHNLRPITSMGIGFLLEGIGKNVRKATKNGELTFIDGGEEPVFGRVTRLIEVSVPKERASDYDGCRLVVNQDLENMMLIRVRIYDRDDNLMEYYGYEDLDLGVRLTDADFDAKNPEYHF